MKLEELRKNLIEEKYLNRWVEEGTWSWNVDGSVDVQGDIVIRADFNRSTLPIKFRKVTGRFDCSCCRSIESLINFPEEVGMLFSVSNNKLTSLDGAPKRAKYFNCHHNTKQFTPEDVRKVCNVAISNIQVY